MPDPVTLALAVKRANAYTDSNISEGGGIPLSQKGAADGVAALDSDGYVTAIRGAVNGRPLGVFTVTEFGATGDGNTDDTDAIQAAIDAAASVGGGTVYFPAGTYIVSYRNPGATNNHCLTLASNVTLAGVAGASVIKLADDQPTTATGPQTIIEARDEWDGADNITIRELVIDGNKAGQTLPTADDTYWDAINIQDGKNLTIIDCLVRNSVGDGIDIDGCADAHIVANTIQDCDGYGVHISLGCRNTKVIGNSTLRNGERLGRGGMDSLEGTYNNTYVGNVSEGDYKGFQLEGENTTYVGNIIKSPLLCGVLITGPVASGVVADNIIDDAGDGETAGTGAGNGIHAQGTGTVAIIGNRVNAPVGKGIDYNAGPGVIIRGNTFTDCGGSGIHLGSSGSPGVIDGNSIRGCTRSISLPSGGTWTVTNNLISGDLDATAAVQDSNAGTTDIAYIGNRILNPAGSGIRSIVGASGRVTATNNVVQNSGKSALDLRGGTVVAMGNTIINTAGTGGIEITSSVVDAVIQGNFIDTKSVHISSATAVDVIGNVLASAITGTGTPRNAKNNIIGGTFVADGKGS